MKRFISLLFLWFFSCLSVHAESSGLGWRQSGIQAPNDAPYLVTTYQSTLSNERLLTSGTPFLGFQDNGANDTFELVIASDLAITDGGTGASTAAGALINLIGTPTKGSMLVGNGTAWTLLPVGADDKVLISDSAQTLGVKWGDPGASALDNESFLVLSLTGDLSNERVATQGTGILITDGGANSTATFSIDTSVVATLSGSQTLSNKTLSNPIIDSQLTIEKGANDYTVTFSTPAAARIINFPDPGATADVVYSVSAQTIGGVKTFSSAPVLSTGTLTVSGNTITFPAASDTVTLLAASQTLTNKTLTSPIFGTQATLTQSSGNYTLTWNNPAAGRAYKIEDVGGTAAFAMKEDAGAYNSGGLAYGDGNKLKIGLGGTNGQYAKLVSGEPTWADPPSGAPGVFTARLSLESGVQFSTSDQLAKTTLYLIGGSIPVYNGSSTTNYNINGGQISISITATNGVVYDVFAYDADSGGDIDTLELVQWTSSTARATAINAVQAAYGKYYYKNGTNGKTYVGTIVASATNQCEDSAKHRGVYSYGLRFLRNVLCFDTTNTWTYASTTKRPFNNSTTLGVGKVRTVTGLSEDIADINAQHEVAFTSGGSAYGSYVGIGINSTSTNSAQIFGSGDASAAWQGQGRASWRGYPSIGITDYYPLEWNASANTYTMQGDNGGAVQTGLTGMVMQ